MGLHGCDYINKTFIYMLSKSTMDCLFQLASSKCYLMQAYVTKFVSNLRKFSSIFREWQLMPFTFKHPFSLSIIWTWNLHWYLSTPLLLATVKLKEHFIVTIILSINLQWIVLNDIPLPILFSAVSQCSF